MEGGNGRKAVFDRVEFGNVIAHDGQRLYAFALDLAGDGVHADHAIDRLPAGHGYRVVEQNFIGDAGLGRHSLPDGEVARVVVGAVAQVLEHMGCAREARVRDPVHAFATHLDQAGGVALHPVGHEVAADAGTGGGALRHFGGGVVWAARAKIRQALDRIAGVAQHLGGHKVAHQQVRNAKCLARVLLKPLRHLHDQARGAQLTQRRQQGLPLGVALAHNARAHRAVVEQVAKLLLHDGGFFLDHQQLAQALCKAL